MNRTLLLIAACSGILTALAFFVPHVGDGEGPRFAAAPLVGEQPVGADRSLEREGPQEDGMHPAVDVGASQDDEAAGEGEDEPSPELEARLDWIDEMDERAEVERRKLFQQNIDKVDLAIAQAEQSGKAPEYAAALKERRRRLEAQASEEGVHFADEAAGANAP